MNTTTDPSERAAHEAWTDAQRQYEEDLQQYALEMARYEEVQAGLVQAGQVRAGQVQAPVSLPTRIPLLQHDGTLTPDAKRRSLLTGMWAMPLMGLGFSCALMPAFIFVVLTLETMGNGLSGRSGLAALMSGVVAGLVAALIGLIAMMIIPWFGILPLLAGASAFFGGLTGSIRSLRTLGVVAPRAVTWRASLVRYAIALCGTNVVAAVAGFGVAQLLSGGQAELHYGFLPQQFPVAAGVYYLLNVVCLIGVGMVVWPHMVRRAERKVCAA